MKFLQNASLIALALSGCVSMPVFAKGQVSVEMPNGDIDTYEDVEISNTPEILYFKSPESNTFLMITKKECNNEDKILVCNQARLGVDTNGVLEELGVKQIVVFINPTQERQPIKGSTVTLGAGTVLVEAATTKGTYITGLGKIDANEKPAGASL
ncbi:MAG: hypothetical protein RLZZ490_1299 [Cyanobacteriota bacterium]